MQRIVPFLLVILSVAHAQPSEKTITRRVDSLFAKQVSAGGPGASVLIARKGKVIYNKAYGSANIELGVDMKPGMVFKIASVSKQFTATALLQLVEQGRLALTDSIQKFIPGYPSKGITIENLLTHTSGIPDYMQIDFRTPFLERWDFSPVELIDSFKIRPLQFEPGTAFRYSNSGYVLLGRIIEIVSHKSYETYLRENIFEPLGMSHTSFDTSNNLIPQRVNGYKKEGSVYKNADFWSMSITYATGSILSNAEDLYKWFYGLQAGKVLKKETLTKAFTPFRLKNGKLTEYGYGWFIQEYNGIRSIGHDGSITGFGSKEMYYPGEDVLLILLFNCGCFPKDEILMDVSAITLGKSMQKEIRIDTTIMNSYLGTYALTIDPNRTITIEREGDHLIGKVTGQGSYPLLFQTETKFQFKNIPQANAEFIKERGKVLKFVIQQSGTFEWKKIK